MVQSSPSNELASRALRPAAILNSFPSVHLRHFLGISATFLTAPFIAGSATTETFQHALEYSTAKTASLATSFLSSSTVFTDYSSTSGVWASKNRTAWTSGFVPGMFWQLYQDTGESVWLNRATDWTNALQANVSDPDNDQGFQIYYSFGLGYQFTGNNNAAFRSSLANTAANFDTQRFNPTIGCYRSWTNTSSNPTGSPSLSDSSTNPNDPIFEVNIDQMMNLELPLYVGKIEGNTTLTNHAIAHADRTWTENIRANGSSVHVVGYNPDGSVQYVRTHQGWKPESTWSRGQAWAVYGYTMVYRYTQLPRMLQHAEACFDYFMSALASQSTDNIPFSDFDAPLDSQNPRDTSAAAIVASASMELFEITGQAKYRAAAETLLLALASAGYISEGTTYEPILRRGSNKWGSAESGTIFGDYYFVEALLRYKAIIGFDTSTDPGNPSPSSAGRLTNISTRAYVSDANHPMIAGFVVEDGSRTFLLRGIGPTLAGFGVSTAVSDPQLRLFNSTDNLTPIAENDNWSTAPNAAQIATTTTTVGGFPLPSGSKDAAILIELPPGTYTLQMSRIDGVADGDGLVEVYDVPATALP